ncbi:MaoC family dehydratase N-terminal domain-containing protein [Enterovirga sp.]|jgi:3-methylfumaryl-CoA hydratase|uniref:FAS1-like dehydratase domain-containing protein n=1 Tax=Enterovirga sp. TaxID=2026350 RepID=UPI00262B73DE|nr:MaoC family dehydratase N-terminal domain-containing protein [Enterovirga sp.]MDB5590466.1 hypothetical protein [Enterovirga sp.]
MPLDPSEAGDGPVDLAHLKTWEGRSETASGTISPWLADAFRATIEGNGAPARGTPESAPLGIHWCVGVPTAAMAEIGPDGHPARGGFLPPVPLPRRMWAGGRLRFPDPLRVGDEITRRSRVAAVEVKHGRTGPLVFVTVEHEVSTARGVAVVEEHDIVYRGLDAGGRTAPAGAPPAQQSSPADLVARTIEPSPVLLFRYSALTFNGHRIHYDRPYVTEVEGYPGLIVHGPLQATLLMGLALDILGGPPDRFAFRAERPLFDLAPFRIEGGREGPAGEVALRARDADGHVTMRATASL